MDTSSAIRLAVVVAGGAMLRVGFAEYNDWRKRRIALPPEIRNGAIVNDRTVWVFHALLWACLIAFALLVLLVVVAFVSTNFPPYDRLYVEPVFSFVFRHLP